MPTDKLMEEICSRWNLPKDYIEFLSRHTDNIYASANADDENLSFSDEIEIYGASGLTAGQHGYSYNPAENTLIDDWDSRYVVIANCNADPYCIDITLDASPVFYAVHGEGEWDFSKDSESLEEFLSFWGVC